MSGPCADCGGPDYQTLLDRIAELDADLSTARRVGREWFDEQKKQWKRAEQAEAALAQRMELRCTSCDDEAECSILTAVCEHSDWEIEDGYQFGCCLHTDLHARAKEGNE